VDETLTDRLLYWHPDRGWTDEPSDALLRISSHVELDVQSASRIQLQQLADDGTWRMVDEQDAERAGRVCYAHPLQVSGKARIAFSSVQPLPDTVWKSVEGAASWDWRDLAGKPLGHPGRALFEWTLPTRQARALWKALQDAGWKMQQRLPQIEQAWRAREQAQALAEQAAQLVALQQERPQVPALAADWRAEMATSYNRIGERIEPLASKVQALHGYWLQMGGDEREQAEGYLSEASTFLAVASRHLHDWKRLPRTELPDVLAELALQRAERGLDSRLDQDGLHMTDDQGRSVVIDADLQVRRTDA
jgi:hypothetical protein